MNEESNHKNSFTAPSVKFTVEILFLCDTYIVVSLCNAISTIGEFKFLSTNIEMLPLGVTFNILGTLVRWVNGAPASAIYKVPLSSNATLSGAVRFQTNRFNCVSRS